MRTWKEEVGLQYFFNASKSPDLSCIENAWVPVDNAIHKQAGLVNTTSELFAIAQDAWDGIEQKSIDSWIRSGRQRYKDCVALGGRFVARERLPRKDGREVVPSDSELDAEGEDEDNWPDQDQFKQ